MENVHPSQLRPHLPRHGPHRFAKEVSVLEKCDGGVRMEQRGAQERRAGWR